MERLEKMRKINIIPLLFVVLSFLGYIFSQMSFTFILNEVITRFIRDGILVLALIIPVVAGMGLNFAITVGAISAQVGYLLVLDWKIESYPGLFLAAVIGSLLSILLGYIIGICLNKVKGKEMITTIIIGFLATSIYQFIFLVCYGTIIPPNNQEILLSRKIGIRNMVDLESYRNIFDNFLVINIGEIRLPIFMIIVVILFALMVHYILNTRLGKQFKAVGESRQKAENLGINTDRVRIKAMVISILLACFGQIFFLQNIGMLNVYTAHLNSDIFSCAALLAGGATIKKANIKNAFLGLFLFHTLFIVSPQAGQNIFSNVALGEYFRSFVAYGTITFALIMNIRHSE
jgi:simple sugar transport system permease protein